MNKRREIKRLAEKAVGDMIDKLYDHMTPVGSFCIQIAANELPPDEIPILHLTNSEVVIENSIHSSPIRYVLAPEYFGKKVRKQLEKMLMRTQELHESAKESADRFIKILREKGTESTINFLAETGFDTDGIRMLFSVVTDRIQDRLREEYPPQPVAPQPISDINIGDIGDVPPPPRPIPTVASAPAEYPPPRRSEATSEIQFGPQPDPLAHVEPLGRHSEALLRNHIRNSRIETVVGRLDEIINEDVHEEALRSEDETAISSEYDNDQQVLACRTIKWFYSDISTTSFIGHDDKVEITNRARQRNISADVIRSMINMFNTIKSLGNQGTTLSQNHRGQAQALIHYLYGNDLIIDIHKAGRLSVCGELLGIYGPYIIEEIALHNVKAERIYRPQDHERVDEVDTIDREDLEAAADVYDETVEHNRQRLYEEMTSRREADRGEVPLPPTAEQMETLQVVDEAMEWRERVEQQLRELDPDREYVRIIEEYYNDFIHNIGWISDPDRSNLALDYCRHTTTPRNPPTMHEVINCLNAREHLSPYPRESDEEDVRQRVDSFQPRNELLLQLDPRWEYRSAIQGYFHSFIYSIGYISMDDRSELIGNVCGQHDLVGETMNNIVTFLNSRQNIPPGRSVRSTITLEPPEDIIDEEDDIVDLELDIEEPILQDPRPVGLSAIPPDVTITAETVLEGTPVRISVDDAALRLFAHRTGTTRTDGADTIGPRVGDELAMQLYASADDNNIPRSSMAWAIQTYDRIHEDESMGHYDEEHRRQSDIFINTNYTDTDLINDDDRLMMIHRAELFGIDTEVFISALDSHNELAQAFGSHNELSDGFQSPPPIPQGSDSPSAVDDPHPEGQGTDVDDPHPEGQGSDSPTEVFDMTRRQ